MIVIAAYIEMSTIVRSLLIIFAVVVAVIGIAATTTLKINAGYFECPNCKEQFVPTMNQYVKGYHTFTKRRLTCPKCGKTSMCKHKIIK